MDYHRQPPTQQFVLSASAGEIRQLSAMEAMTSSSGSSSSVGASSSASDATVVGAKSSCKVRVYANGCEEKRSCRDCLNTADDDGLECYLDAATATCGAFADVPAAALDGTKDLTNATERVQLLAKDYRVYASTTQRYCSVNDGACTLCEAMADLRGYAPSSNQLKKMSSDRAICYGSNNCICVAKCESTSWNKNAGARCSSELPSYSTPSPDSDSTKTKMLTFIGVFAVLQIIILVVMVVRKQKQIRQRREANGPYNTAGVISDENRLQLPGWMAWQDELRENERKNDTPYVVLHNLRPSSSRLTATASEASIATLPLSSPPSSHPSAASVLERASM